MTRFWITIDQVDRFIIDRMDDWDSGYGKIFIPKMKSASVLSIAKIVAPGAEIKEIGIRKGEKLHEALIAFEESKYMKEEKDYYILSPFDQQIESNRNWAYFTDTNEFFSEDELRGMM